MRKDKALPRKILTWAAIAAAVYFGNVQLQTFLGHRALAATGLEVLDLESGLNAAAVSDKLVLADLSAIWCSSCRTFDRKVLADEEVRALIDESFIFVRVEYESDEGKLFRERYGVNGFPKLLVIDAEGNLIAQLPTTYDPVVFRTSLGGV